MNKFICSLAFLCCFYSGYAQGEGGVTPSFDYTAELSRAVAIPNSPEAQAFVKYGTIPFNHYTGTTNISVPICEIQGNSYSIPISMTYDATGIKVGQLATNVGLGWNLNYGGVVSRQVHGLPDQATGGYAKITDTQTRDGLEAIYKDRQMTSYDTADEMYYGNRVLENYRLNNIDTQADTFSFSVNGLSGTIGINYDVLQNGKYRVFCIENPHVQIDYTLLGDKINSWIITDTDGTTYQFAKAEYTFTSYSTEQNEYDAEYISSWYVTRIQTANGEDTIDYQYSNGVYYQEGQYLPNNIVWEYYYDSINNNRLEKSVITQHKQTIYKIKQFYPTAILLNNTPVLTTSVIPREDLLGQSAISNITVHNTVGQTVKNIALDYSYFTTGNPSTQQLEKGKRLKLDRIRFIETLGNPDGGPVPGGPSLEEKVHSFEYFNPTSLPPRDSNAMDLWGYSNGNNHSTVFVPGNNHSFNQQFEASIGEQITGADRRPNLSYAKNGTLKKITYPTGGSTTFYYDAHRGSIEQDNAYSNRSSIVYGGNNNHPIATNDLNDCPNLDDIAYENTIQNVSNAKLIIDADNANKAITFDVDFINNVQGNPVATNNIKFICIYKSRFGTNECQTYPCPDPGQGGLIPNECATSNTYTICDRDDPPLTYCDIMTSDPYNNPNIVYINTNPGPDFTLNLEEGDYRMLLVNGYQDTSLSVNYKLITTINRINTVGGLRVNKIESTPSNESDEKLTKYYYYNELPENTTITPSLVENQFTSSGIIHQKIRFSEEEFHYGKLTRSTSTHCSVLGGGSSPGGTGSINEYINATVFKFYSYNLAPKTRHNIAYSKVTELLFNNDTFQGSTLYEYYNDDDGLINNHQPYFVSKHLNGKPKKTSHYDNAKNKLQESEQEYQQITLDASVPYNGIFMIPDAVFHHSCTEKVSSGNTHTVTVTAIPGESTCNLFQCNGTPGGTSTFLANRYRLTPVWTRLEKQTEKQYFSNDSVTTITKHFYDNTIHKQVTRTETTKNTEETILSKTYYPQDAGSLTDLSTTNLDAINKLSSQHRIATPIQVETYLKTGVDSALLSKTRTEFKDWGGEKIYPEIISTKDPMASNWDERMRYINYDDQGHPLEVTQTHGAPSVFIWGYNNRYPIAKISNATYAGMPTDLTNLINEIKTTSNTENSTVKETNMQTLMETLRTHDYFKDSEVTTYTYDPQIGVTSITDPRGERIQYYYDGFNRLEAVKDNEGNLISEHKYHYKN
ncbi:RHS repeat protein [Aquimarina sp. 2304DJ70-9]|uniref:RHS repeat protein n=1 Tax=Aquimarina penaris TaxID=3231044 RepID=UPI003462347D